MSNIIVEDGVIKYVNHKLIKKYTDDTKKDLSSETKLDTVVIFKDKNGAVYPDGKIIVNDEFVTMFNYTYNKDKNDRVMNCIVDKTVKKNDKLLDIEKTSTTKYYDQLGRLIKVEYATRDGIVYQTTRYEYDSDNNVILKRSKNTHTIKETKYYKGEVSSIIETTIKSKMSHTQYRAFFDNNDRIYKVINGVNSVEIDYERDFDGDGNVLSETQRFFDIKTTNKKLISYIVTTYIPAAGYKVGKVIKNGILVEEHTYNLKGDEIALVKIENGKEIFTRTERTKDSDTDNITIVTNTKTTDCESGKVIKDKTFKQVYDKDNNLLIFSEDNSIVSNYEYDEEGRRSSVITKKLINEEFVVINEIHYTYTTDEETGDTIRKRELTVFDANGNVVDKDIHEEKFTDNTDEFTQEIMMFEKVEE